MLNSECLLSQAAHANTRQNDRNRQRKPHFNPLPEYAPGTSSYLALDARILPYSDQISSPILTRHHGKELARKERNAGRYAMFCTFFYTLPGPFLGIAG
jgi:hypothetical protein